MKKLILSLLMLFVATSVVADEPRPCPRGERPDPQQIFEARCRLLVERMKLDEAKAEQFKTIYRNYQQEMMQLHRDFGHKHHSRRHAEPQTTPTEEQIEELMLGRFALSRAIVDVRERYYKEFRKVLSPRQIQHIYEMEREGGERMQHRHRNHPHSANRGAPPHRAGEAPRSSASTR